MIFKSKFLFHFIIELDSVSFLLVVIWFLFNPILVSVQFVSFQFSSNPHSKCHFSINPSSVSFQFSIKCSFYFISV